MRLLAFVLIIGFSIAQFFNISYFRVSRFKTATEWAHPPRKNNHAIIAREFADEIEKYPLSPKRVGLVETRYMNGDRCVRIRYILRASNSHNFVILSARGVYPTAVINDFLRSAEGLEFLIGFSQSEIGPDFSGLLDFSRKSQKEEAARAIDLFRRFKILRTSRLYPERLYIFLLKRE